MVRGRTCNQVTKSQTGKKSMSTLNKSGATSSPAQASHSASKGHKTKSTATNVPSCCSCGTIITDDTRALQCDRCVSAEVWKCADCLNLTGDLYDHLVADSNPMLRWFCDGCEKAVMNMDTASCSPQNVKLDNLIALVEKIMEKYENIDRKLDEKCDINEAAKLEMRIKSLEDRVSKIDQDSTRLTRSDEERESRIASLETEIKAKASARLVDKDGGISDEVLIKHVVQEEISRKSVEEKDIESRKCNIIIYRVPEKRSDDVAQRRQDDEIFVRDLLDGVFNMKLEDGDIVKMFRLGRWSEDKCRSLLSFKDRSTKECIMSNLRNLKQPVARFKGISIAHDLHPTERNEIKRMVEAAKQEHTDDGVDSVENYRFVVVGRGLRRKVIKIKKSTSYV